MLRSPFRSVAYCCLKSLYWYGQRAKAQPTESEVIHMSVSAMVRMTVARIRTGQVALRQGNFRMSLARDGPQPVVKRHVLRVP